MSQASPLLAGLFSDTLPPDPGTDRGTGHGSGQLASALEGHLALLASPLGPVVDVLRVPDDRLTAVGRVARERGPTDPGSPNGLRVSVVTSGGAGGLVSLARRSIEGVRLAAVESTLRDLDDPRQNAERVIAAAHELDPSIAVFVGLPAAPPSGPTAGWIRAAETVEAAGLQARLRADGQSRSALAEQLGVLIELDLAFAVEVGHTVHPWSLLAAVAALIEDAGADEAAALLSSDAARAAAVLAGFDEAAATRTRRRVLRIDLPSTSDLLGLSASAGFSGLTGLTGQHGTG